MSIRVRTPESGSSRIAGGLSENERTARTAYDALALDYDALTATHDHERWLATLVALARRHGLRGRRVLDVGCGTGRSFEPLLRRGYAVRACDVSPEMVRVARRRFPRVRVEVADMRALPRWGRFRRVDLVTCLDDALNYLPAEPDLDAAFAGIARSLRRGGLFVFDLNSLRTYRTAFAQSFSVDAGDVRFVVCGEAAPDALAGAVCLSRIEVHTRDADGAWRRRVSEHAQRHWPTDTVCARLAEAGLRPVALHGQTTGCVLHQTVDEARDTKVIVVARRD